MTTWPDMRHRIHVVMSKLYKVTCIELLCQENSLQSMYVLWSNNASFSAGNGVYCLLSCLSSAPVRADEVLAMLGVLLSLMTLTTYRHSFDVSRGISFDSCLSGDNQVDTLMSVLSWLLTSARSGVTFSFPRDLCIVGL